MENVVGVKIQGWNKIVNLSHQLCKKKENGNACERTKTTENKSIK